jgi:phenylalanyl-tRNA synthetase beta chain
VATNEARGIDDVALFEIGTVFLPPVDGVLPDERTRVAGVLAGSVHRAPVEPDRAVDVYDAVDVVQVRLDALEIADHRLVPATPAGFHAGRTATVEVAGVEVGAVGEIAASATGALGLAGRAVGFELDLDSLFVAPRRDRTFVRPSPYPPAEFDLAFVVADEVPAADIAATLRDSGGALVEDVRVFDEFRSEELGADRRSLAFRLRYRAPDRTLTDEEVGGMRTQAIDAVERAHGAEVRA